MAGCRRMLSEEGEEAFHPNRAFFDGWIDEVMIFNRKLSEEEIRAIHDRRADGPEKKDAPPAPKSIHAHPPGPKSWHSDSIVPLVT